MTKHLRELLSVRLLTWSGAFALMVLAQQAVQAEPITVLTPEIEAAPQNMVQNWLNQQTEQQFRKWNEKYEQTQTPEQVAEYQQRLRSKFVENIGGFPERTPLNAKTTGVVPREKYRVEKILFESQPNHYVTGACFVPNSPEFKAPYPAVLIVCGHSATGKAIETYQSGAALLALNGMIGFLIDPICQGERYEHLTADGKIALTSTTTGHSLVGTGSILLGQNVARNEIWDGMRGIDYLQQRDDVDPERIGCMGNSGGGTQTSYIMALEDRVKAASPACYITDFKHLLEEMGPQDAEQNIFGQLAWGMDHADYLMLRAPSPVMVSAATHDMFPIEGTWNSFRKAKRFYEKLDQSERIGITEAEGKHGWSKQLREASVEWMARWLGGRNIDVHEPKLQLLTDQEFQVTPRGQVLLLDGARSAFDLNIEELNRLEKARKSTPKERVAAARRLAGIRTLSELPEPTAKKLGESTEAGIQIERWVLTTEPGILLPALLYRPAHVTKGPLLFVHPRGKQTEFTAQGKTYSALGAAKEGHLVLAVDLRGTGETQPAKATWYQKRFGIDGRQLATAYLLGKNYVGIWGEEILQAGRWLLKNPAASAGDGKLTLVTEGRLGVAALHAAAVEADLFSHVSIFHTLPDWRTIVGSKLHEDQFVYVIHGAAREYDLPDLIAVLGQKLEFAEPADALGQISSAAGSKK